MKTVAVIGGGITGLAIAEALQGRSEDVRAIVLEAETSPGGKIKTKHKNGFVIETGPHGFLDKEPAMRALVDRLGLSSQLVTANPSADNRYVMRDGRLRKIPVSPPAFLVSDILPLLARLRILLEPWVARGDPGLEESIHDFACRRLGETAANVLVDAFVTGIYGGDPKKLSAAAAFPRLLELEREYGSLIRAQIGLKKSGAAPSTKLLSFSGGLACLIDALVERLDVRCNQVVKQIQKRGQVFQIETESLSLKTDAVVITTPAYEAARLTRAFSTPLSARLKEIPYAPVSVVVHGFSKNEIARPLDGFGFLVPGREKRPILGSIWASTVFEAHAPNDMVMFRTLLGGRRNPEAAQGTKEEIAARALEQIRQISGIADQATAQVEETIVWERGIPQYEMGHQDRVSAADELESRVPGLYLSGNAYRGVAMIQCVAEAEKIADRIQKQLRT
jgi:oxygen-dependent protoporphyrinogen oxidase